MHRTKVHVNNTITTQHVVPHVRFQISFPFPVILCYLSQSGLWGDRNTANGLMIQKLKKKREDKEEK